MKRLAIFLAASFCLTIGLASPAQAQTPQTKSSGFQPGSFGYDLSFLKEKDKVIVLKNKNGEGQLIVSPGYQAKVFTSTTSGLHGKSFGWVNYKAFIPKTDPHMNAYGGEDRLWLGPEGGKFSLFFPKGAKMEFVNWKTPTAVDTEAWQLLASTGKSVQLHKELQLVNYAGTTLDIALDRTITILEDEAIAAQLKTTVPSGVKSVAFETLNALKNAGKTAWTQETGAPCLWNLDMLAPSPSTTIIVPYHEEGSGKVATTDYFGEIPSDRIRIAKGILLFKADGKSRGKLGLPPHRARQLAASYNAADGILTIATFDVDPKGIYLNQEWNTTKDPFSGDAVNAYNDGPLADGSQMGPFYELESVSPAALLKPGEQILHHHRLFHFTGEKSGLNQIATQVLGIGLEEIAGTFGGKHP
ncbi:MAG: hypothetical protein LWW85_12445 [Marinilabiliales bacterium]|nr:hypothetical protein [Marinilabiliales bacterium]